jgi:flavin reductase (DIM6/NTAB) family NADH-FMN oxidoreductase RutF/rubredoxin
MFHTAICAGASQIAVITEEKSHSRFLFAPSQQSEALLRSGMEDEMDIRTFFQLNYGVYITTSLDGDRAVGCVTNSIMQITAEPATFAVSVNHDNYTNGCIKKTGKFAFSVLGEDTDPALIGTFGFHSSRDTDKFQHVPVKIAGGLPVIASSCGYVVCRLIGTLEAPTHTIFLGQAEEAEILNGSAAPMTYSYYHRVVKGKAPKNAPTWQPEQQKTEEEPSSAKPDPQGPASSVSSEKWICQVCGYVYEGKQPPEDFRCPICGRGPEFFKKE